MCGIFGIVDQNNQGIQRKLLERGIELVAHRGPDGQGIYQYEQVGFAHRRLAIVDLSNQGKQPMHYRGHTIVYNGMIYNYLELRLLLEKAGYTFQSQTDTEVILAAYDHWGRACTEQFNGMWAFAIHDKKRGLIFCSRDRFGIKPFYYCQIGSLFCFASEIKQFTTLPHWNPQINPTRSYEFLAWGYHDHTAETFFKDVYQLRGGQQLVYQLQTHTYAISTYYQATVKKSASSIDFEDASTQFRELLTDAVRLRLRADVNTGTALSGGLDSSSIVGLIHELLPKDNSHFESVSACFKEPQYDENPYIDAVVAKTTVRAHKVYPTFEDCFSTLDQLTWQQDEPIAGAGVFAQYKVFEQARAAQLIVMLDGQGADEILAGYEKFYLPHFKKLLRQRPLEAMRQLFQFFQIHQIGPQDAWKTFYQYRQKKKQGKVNWLNVDAFAFESPLYQRPAASSIAATSLQLLSGIGLPVLLHYEDRNSMAFGVESRLPFLDYRLVEFSLNLPDDFKINQAKRKYILRQAMKKVLPKKVQRRYDKMGFATPQEKWMREHRPLFQKTIKEAMGRANGLFRQELLDLDDFHCLWRVIAFDSWLRQFNVKNTLGA